MSLTRAVYTNAVRFHDSRDVVVRELRVSVPETVVAMRIRGGYTKLNDQMLELIMDSVELQPHEELYGNPWLVEYSVRSQAYVFGVRLCQDVKLIKESQRLARRVRWRRVRAYPFR